MWWGIAWRRLWWRNGRASFGRKLRRTRRWLPLRSDIQELDILVFQRKDLEFQGTRPCCRVFFDGLAGATGRAYPGSIEVGVLIAEWDIYSIPSNRRPTSRS